MPAALRAAIAADLNYLVSKDSQGRIVHGAHELAAKLLEKFPAETLAAVLRQESVSRR